MKVLFFDIDNTLYSKTAGVEKLMGEYIHRYIATTLNLDDESAEHLHKHYYRDYGLAIEGLVRFNHINALEYNAEVDDALPLDEIIKPDPKLRNLLERIDKTKVKLWLFTNAYKNHGNRVIRLLGLEGIFEGMTYCDYEKVPILCKPKKDMFQKAMDEAGAKEGDECYFIDDSLLNVTAAAKLGWKQCVLFDERNEHAGKGIKDTITSLYQLPDIMPQFFSPST